MFFIIKPHCSLNIKKRESGWKMTVADRTFGRMIHIWPGNATEKRDISAP
jgi:hypothetical protein